MGVTISHTVFPPLALIGTIVGFASFAFTLATFLRVCQYSIFMTPDQVIKALLVWTTIEILYGASHEIKDHLSTLKQGLLEERRHLREVKRRLHHTHPYPNANIYQIAHGRSHSIDVQPPLYPPTSRRGSWSGDSRRTLDSRRRRKEKHRPERDFTPLDNADESTGLANMRLSLQEMIRDFRKLEHPFLKPEFQDQTSREWVHSTPSLNYHNSHARAHNRSHDHSRKFKHTDRSEESFPDAIELQDLLAISDTNRLGYEYQECSIAQRWLWLKTKSEVRRLSEALSRLQVRGVVSEVGKVLLMVADVGREVQEVRLGVSEMEGRLGRVVGLRRLN